MSTITVPTKSVPFIRKLFPDYKRRDIRIVPTEKVSFYDLNWSGGTRQSYSLVRLADEATLSLAHWSQAAPWDNPMEGATMDMKPGFLVVRTGFFCGKPSMLTIHVHPSNLTPLLPTTNA